MQVRQRPPTTPARPGLWARHVHPRLLDAVMDTDETRRIRQRVCAPLTGEVLEIGFGTGHNLPFLPDRVSRVLAVDHLPRGMDLAAERVEATHADVELVGSDAQQLPLDDRSIDTVLCTWSLCSIDDPTAAIAEVLRVLRPGGTLHLVEHGLAPDARVRTWQQRLDPMWRRLAGGCHINRDMAELLARGGLAIEALDTYYTESEPRVLGWTFEGRAQRP